MTDIFRCKFCKEELHNGFDKDDMIHCQLCHRVWDGCAQCPCWSDSSDAYINELDDIEKVGEEVVEEVVKEVVDKSEVIKKDVKK